MRQLQQGLLIFAALGMLLFAAAPAVADVGPLMTPAGVTPGRDGDRDHLPKNVTIHRNNTSVDDDLVVHREPAPPLVLDVDPDDRNAGPPNVVDLCTGAHQCAHVTVGDQNVWAGGSLLPQYECKPGRITLCWHYTVWVAVSWWDDDGAYIVHTPDFVILP